MGKLLTVIIIILIPLKIALSQAGGTSIFLNNSDYLTHGDFIYMDSPNYNFNNVLTIAAWVKWSVNPQTYVNNHWELEGKWANIITMDNHISKDNGQFWLQHSSGNTAFEWAIATNSERKYIQSTTVPVIDKWYYIVGVYNGNGTKKMILYINGIEEASLSSGISGNIKNYSDQYKLNVGRLPSGYRLFPGEVDEIRIWKRALSPDEIRRQMFSKTTIDNNNLVSFWDYNEGAGTTLIDKGSKKVNGKFYTALVDVHSYTTNPNYTVSDLDKSWGFNDWLNCQTKTVAGAGVNEINMITGNNSNTLTFQNAWITTPILDDNGAGTGMTWYGIEKSGEGSQWVNAGEPVGEECKLVNTTDSIAVGWAGASLSVVINSVPDASNNLSIYFWGTVDGNLITDEIYPIGIARRTRMVWGVEEWGDVTAGIFISYPNVIGDFKPEESILMQRHHGSNIWTAVNNAISNPAERTFYVSNVSSFMEYTVGMTESINPVSLLSFNYTLNKNVVNLKWVTSSEINNKGFEVQKSDAVHNIWQSLIFINGKGNTNNLNEYNYTDKCYTTGKYKYRIKQQDFNGNYEYFYLPKLVEIINPSKFILYQNYPNPANPQSKINYEISLPAFVKLSIYDMTGKEVRVLCNETQQAGYYTLNFDGSNLSSGIYFYKLEVKNESNNFSEVKKLILIK